MAETTKYSKGDEFFSSGRTYTVISNIRSNRQNEVYKIERKSDKRPFLLKVMNIKNMKSGLINNGKPAVIRYLDTSNLAQQLSVFDWGAIDEEHYFIISRYFTKGLLSDRLRQGSLKLHTAINIVLDLAKTLSSLQAYDIKTMTCCPMRHGAICPNNIMYDFDEKGDYKVYLIDIEHTSYIARDNHDACLSTDLENIDHKYCAPELFISEPVYNSDIFSLGIVLYECCFGEYPFPYDAELYRIHLMEIGECVSLEYFNDIMKYTPPYLEQKNCGGIAGILIHLLRGMLERDPAKRLNVTSVLSQLTLLSKLTRIHDVELSDEKAYDDQLIGTFRGLSKEYEDTYTMSGSRIEFDFYHDLGPLQRKSEDDDLLDLLKEDFGFEKTGNEFSDKSEEGSVTNPELGYAPLVRRHNKNARGFKDIAGMENLKEMMSKKVLYFLKNPEVAAEYKIAYPNGMLLYGPPGCGKTFFAEKFAEESGFSYALVKASDLGSTWIHGTQGKINELFKEAKAKAPTVICFDEFDAFVPDRSKVTNTNHSGEVNEFLSQLNNCGQHKIFIIATTNNPEGIDPAVLRSGRLEHKIYIPAPDLEARKAVIKMGVLCRPCSDSIDFDRLAELTEGYVTSDLSLIVNDAAMNAAYARTFITQELLEEAISGYKPSVPANVLKDHEEIRRRMESANKTQNRIGFK